MRNDENIKCPKCGAHITIDQAIVQKMVDIKVKNQVENDRKTIEENLRQEFATIQNKELSILKDKLNRAQTDNENSIKKELEFLKKEEEFTDKLRKQDLIIAQKLKERQVTIEDKIRKEEIEKNQFLIAEMRKQLEDTKKALTDAQRKAQQGSMQTQGEVLELSLESAFAKHFPQDKIDPVPKGISGADIIQTVISQAGQNAGMIAWESKRTKSWSEDWIQKLKDDARNIKANLCVLITETLPKDINNFGLYNGIWVCDYASTIGLATALRHQILAVHNTITINTGKDEKMEILYNHLCSPAFAQKVEVILENSINMQKTLEKEKMVMNKVWTVRETQIKRLQDSTVKMYGEIQGIAGKTLPDIELLELESGLDDIDNSRDKPTKKPTANNDQSSLFKQ